MTRTRALQVVCALIAGAALASLPFLQYRWHGTHQHSHLATNDHGQPDRHPHGDH